MGLQPPEHEPEVADEHDHGSASDDRDHASTEDEATPEQPVVQRSGTPLADPGPATPASSPE